MINASEVPQPDNPAEAVSDNKLETRWAASGNGQWIQLDLGEEKDIIAFVLAFMNGVERTYYYNIEISTDGVNYTPLITDGFSIGKDGYEITNLDKAVKARFIRYTGAGNSANAWNSVTEFGALGIKLN